MEADSEHSRLLLMMRTLRKGSWNTDGGRLDRRLRLQGGEQAGERVRQGRGRGRRLPEVEVGQRLQVAQAGRQRTHPVVVEAQALQGHELAQLLGQLAQPVSGQVWGQDSTR